VTGSGELIGGTFRGGASGGLVAMSRDDNDWESDTNV